MSIDQRVLEKFKSTYEAMNDETLALIARNKFMDLTEEARLALKEVIRHRPAEAFAGLTFEENEGRLEPSEESAPDAGRGRVGLGAVFGWFRKEKLLDPDLAEWQLECFEWLLKHTGGIEAYRQRKVIQPTREFFPNDGSRGHELAQRLFQQVKVWAGMEEWPCRLEQQDESQKTLVASKHLLLPPSDHSPAGTFRALEEGGAVITYHPRSLQNPMSLVATFAHELAHYRTAGFPEPPPGGWEVWEPATDIAAVFLGFGIFLANSRFHFEHFTEDRKTSFGWRQRSGYRWQNQGYISDAEVLHMHALVSKMLGAGVGETLPHLKPALHGIYKRMDKDISWPEIAARLGKPTPSTRGNQVAPAKVDAI
ncbi:hypothetical protein [Dyella flagellata]|nr:hypothetical protein [Dyella flagellata]